MHQGILYTVITPVLGHKSRSTFANKIKMAALKIFTFIHDHLIAKVKLCNKFKLILMLGNGDIKIKMLDPFFIFKRLREGFLKI